MFFGDFLEPVWDADHDMLDEPTSSRPLSPTTPVNSRISLLEKLSPVKKRRSAAQIMFYHSRSLLFEKADATDVQWRDQPDGGQIAWRTHIMRSNTNAQFGGNIPKWAVALAEAKAPADWLKNLDVACKDIMREKGISRERNDNATNRARLKELVMDL